MHVNSGECACMCVCLQRLPWRNGHHLFNEIIDPNLNPGRGCLHVPLP